MPISSLLSADSPRLAGENLDHVRTLAESDATLPPIIVDRATNRVIDGMHRLRAAVLRGQDEIEVQFFDGNQEDAFALAVKTNIVHGLPLSLADRTAAATRILRSHGLWSDRAVASATGLSAKTVGAIRRRSSKESHQLNMRLGRDQRLRPLSTDEGRKIASELMTNRPDASLREIAHLSGISLGTAHNVRKRLRRSENPILSKQAECRNVVGDRTAILHNLIKDPSLRLAETGRVLLRLLHPLSFDTREWDQLIDIVPAHCVTVASAAARACGEAWHEFAKQLERR